MNKNSGAGRGKPVSELNRPLYRPVMGIVRRSSPAGRMFGFLVELQNGGLHEVAALLMLPGVDRGLVPSALQPPDRGPLPQGLRLPVPPPAAGGPTPWLRACPSAPLM